MISKAEEILNDTLKLLSEIEKIEKLEELENEILGRKGALTLLLKEIRNVAPEKRSEFGKTLNKIKITLENELESKRKALQESQLQEKLKKEKIDVTLPGKIKRRGSIHPLSQAQRKIEEIFISMGFSVLDGPEVETEYFNFDALNVPKEHPARDMQDTFWISKESENSNENVVLRTQTSNVQVIAMKEFGVPLRVIIPGKVFRNEATDATHEIDFNQVEGLLIDENVSIANLKAVIKDFFSAFFEKEISVRLRPGYFPFVEPGLEMDLSCIFCNGKGCKICKKTGWIEFMGCGMIHENVLKNGGIDPRKYNGFAFGFGITRLVMMKYGIDDIRLLRSANLRFLEQF